MNETIKGLICGTVAMLVAACAQAETKHLGYWLHGKNMKDVGVRSLASLGTTDVFLNEHAFKLHERKDVDGWIAKAEKAGIGVHVWMQVFYDGMWINPFKGG